MLNSRWRRLFPIQIIFLVIWTSACSPQDESESTLLVSDVLGGKNTEGFKKATEKIHLRFPEDHGAHPQYKNEWWYLTGNLVDRNHRRFGYQVTFFRVGLSGNKLNYQQKTSAWRTNQIWMAHFAITDVDKQTHTSSEQFTREALNLSGASTPPLKVWLGDWQLVAQDSETEHGFPWYLNVQDKTAGLALTLNSIKPLVLQGDEGLSQKGKSIGNASYYYSFTRLATQGVLTLNDNVYQVTGSSWMDREWSTSLLEENQVGWDWFSLQLDSNDEMMFFQLRTDGDESSQNRQGKWIDSKGEAQTINANQVSLQPLRWWISPDGKRFPVRWQLNYPDKNADWIIDALVDEQYMKTSIRYWEGAVKVVDRKTNMRLGLGYLEMTGY